MPLQQIFKKRAIQNGRRTRFLRAIALMLSISFLFLFTGCYPTGSEKADEISNPTFSRIVSPENKRFLRTDEWVRMLALVLNFPDDRPSLWASIPAAQRNEISYSDFLTYITELESGLRAQITSFSKMTDEEKETLLRRMSRTGIVLEPKPEHCSYWWLHGKTEDGRTLRFAIAVTADEYGTVFFRDVAKQYASDVQLHHFVYRCHSSAIVSGAFITDSTTRTASVHRASGGDRESNRRYLELLPP